MLLELETVLYSEVQLVSNATRTLKEAHSGMGLRILSVSSQGFKRVSMEKVHRYTFIPTDVL